MVESASSGASCGLPRVRRELGLFVARREDGRLSSNLCWVVTPHQMERAARGTGSGAPPGAAAGCGAG